MNKKSNFLLSDKQKFITTSKRVLKILLLVYASSTFSDDTFQLPAPVSCPDCARQITQGLRWNYVLLNPPQFNYNAEVYDIDGVDNSAAVITKIHKRNAKAICYISAGTWENWRPDAKEFPTGLLGKSNGWSGEKWLDIRQINLLKPIMQARVAVCRDKGFDAIEFDNVDGYTNHTGFPLTSNDQLKYNIFLANLAHQAGLAVGLKNDPKQIKQLVPYFDFAINEQCFQYSECDSLEPFIEANKAVLNVEYNLNPDKFCQQAASRHFSSIKKNVNLPEEVYFCN